MFGCTRQVYYRGLKAEKTKQQRAENVLQLVRDVRMVMPRLGTKKLYHLLQLELKALGVGRDKLFTILKANHMLIKPRRTYHVTTNSMHRYYKHKNLIKDLVITRPEQVWVSDITYVGSRKNPMYLSLVTDAYSKKIMGYDVSNTLETQGALNALKQALRNRKYPGLKLIHHSDRGVQYCSNAYQNALTNKKVICSMTEAYDPYENAIAERINGILKQEFIEIVQIDNLQLMDKVVNQSVGIYNTLRPHLSSQMNTPDFMHKQNKIKPKGYKKENLSKNVFAEV